MNTSWMAQSELPLRLQAVRPGRELGRTREDIRNKDAQHAHRCAHRLVDAALIDPAEQGGSYRYGGCIKACRRHHRRPSRHWSSSATPLAKSGFDVALTGIDDLKRMTASSMTERVWRQRST